VKRRFLVTFALLAVAHAPAQDAPSPVAPPPAAEREYPPIPANWPDKEYAEVRAYLYNPGEKPGNLILQKGKLHPEVVNPEGIKLEAKQVEQLLVTFRGKAGNGMGVGCFEPHHGFVFYDRGGNPVADVTVCFLCIQGVARPSPAGSMTTWDLDALKRLVQDLGLPVFKTHEEAETHFIELARTQWPEAKVKAVLDGYLFSEAGSITMDDYAVLKLLQGLGKRTHPYLLDYLANNDGKTNWLEKDGNEKFSRRRLHRLCDLCGDIPPAAAIPLLAPYLIEAEASARCEAAETIAKTGAPEIVPFVRKAFADTGRDVSLSALVGLQVAISRGTLHADAKGQLFEDVKALESRVHAEDWAKALIGLDSNKAMEFFLSPEIFKPDSPRLDKILATMCEMNLQLPRGRILALVAELRATKLDRDRRRIMEPALLLLGRQRNPDDLELLRGMGNEALASCAMPGLLAWHGLEDYRDHLSKRAEEKGFAALNEAQRLHFSANKFETNSIGLYYFFLDARGDQWRDALAGLKAMKRDGLAEILKEGLAKFGAEGPSNDDETRYAQLKALREKHAFDELDERLEKAADSQDLSLDRFAIEHAESFK
jgi:hypothetical protein